jgi:hypothetical protein
MSHHVSRQISAGLSDSDKCKQISALMHKARKTPGFKSSASFRAIEETKQNPDGNQEKVIVLFVRTGKESLLENLKSWWNRKEQQALAEKFIRDAFGAALSNVVKIDCGCMPWFTSSPRIGPDELAVKVVNTGQSRAAEYSLVVENMARDVQHFRGKNKTPGAGSFINVFDNAKLGIRGCLGLSKGTTSLEKFNKLFSSFIKLLDAVSGQPIVPIDAKNQKELIDGAQEFCRLWLEQWKAEPLKHFNLARRYPQVATMNMLVASFLRWAPPRDGEQVSMEHLNEMAEGRSRTAALMKAVLQKNPQ